MEQDSFLAHCTIYTHTCALISILTRPWPTLYHLSLQFASFINPSSEPFVIFKNRGLAPLCIYQLPAGAHNITIDNKQTCVQVCRSAFQISHSQLFVFFKLSHGLSHFSCPFANLYRFFFDIWKSLLLASPSTSSSTPILVTLSASGSRQLCSHTNQPPHSQHHPFLIQNFIHIPVHTLMPLHICAPICFCICFLIFAHTSLT